VRFRRTLLAALAAAAVALLAVPALGHAKRHGVQRNFAGARWAPSPNSFGWYAHLRLDRALVVDRRTGGFIAQTLWSTTNNSSTRYGRNTGAPYIQAAVTRGWHGRNINAIVVSQRSVKGRYYEGRSPGPAVRFGQDYSFSVVANGDKWKVFSGPDTVATVRGTGEPATRSGFAGIESSDPGSHAAGAVTQMYWAVKTGAAKGVPFPRWRVGKDKKNGAKLVKRGPGHVRWIDRQYSLSNSFGP
jgi:hypothetical protein